MAKPFKNLKELERYLKNSKNLDEIMGVEYLSAALKDASKLLFRLLKEQLEAYYNSYTPETYKRTYDLLYSLRISPVYYESGSLSIAVYFDRDVATHPSIFGGEDGYAAWLINDGWAWKKRPNNIYRLSHYEGFQFVEKAIEEFNKRNKWGFTIRREGEYK